MVGRPAYPTARGQSVLWCTLLEGFLELKCKKHPSNVLEAVLSCSGDVPPVHRFPCLDELLFTPAAPLSSKAAPAFSTSPQCRPSVSVCAGSEALASFRLPPHVSFSLVPRFSIHASARADCPLLGGPPNVSIFLPAVSLLSLRRATDWGVCQCVCAPADVCMCVCICLACHSNA